MSDAAEARALIERLRKIAERAGETMESLIDHGELEQADNTWAVDEFHQAHELHEVANLAASALEAANAEPDDERGVPIQIHERLTAAARGVPVSQLRRVPVSRDELEDALFRDTYSSLPIFDIVEAIEKRFDIYPKADRKPADSSNGDDRG